MGISRPSQAVGRCRVVKHDRDAHNEAQPKRWDKLTRTREDMIKDGINSLDYAAVDIARDRLYTFITVDVGVPLK